MPKTSSPLCTHMHTHTHAHLDTLSHLCSMVAVLLGGEAGLGAARVLVRVWVSLCPCSAADTGGHSCILTPLVWLLSQELDFPQSPCPAQREG